ncbi:hypothetical protein [Levilactobacillus brevis]
MSEIVELDVEQLQKISGGMSKKQWYRLGERVGRVAVFVGGALLFK